MAMPRRDSRSDHVMQPLAPHRPKSRIAVFIDGTGNQADPREGDGRTNVRRLFEDLEEQPDVARLYLPGVGCEAVPEMDPDSAGRQEVVKAVDALLGTGLLASTWRVGQVFGEFFGAGLTARVLAAYAFICAMRKYHPGARISIVGFSRGAYACCVLAHFMELAGMVVAENELGLQHDEVLDVWTYDDAKLAALVSGGAATPWQVPAGLEGLEVDFLGCWDTVCAMGAPEHGLQRATVAGWIADRIGAALHRGVMSANPRFVKLFVPPNVVRARHALALHEYRVAFEPLLWSLHGEPDRRTPTDLVQMWFPGVHADVGGGYLETDDACISSDPALCWMKHGMWPERWSLWNPYIDAWPIHDSSTGRFAESTPALRRAWEEADDEQLKTMDVFPWLGAGLESVVKLRPCDGADPAAKDLSPAGFRPEIERLHAQTHDLVRLAWLRGKLLNVAASAGGRIPALLDHPTAAEAAEAACARDRFVHELDLAGLARLASDADRARRVSRLCCYHMALGRNLSDVMSPAVGAIQSTTDPVVRDAAKAVIGRVILPALTFVLGEDKARVCESLVQVASVVV